ncbi:RDD family protein [Kitasatospora sp. NPDC058965]|uniref:RDD family protein n=1 Tax=Kitasatospora sp. NPDC058965 TaxID=3346682 RepID=UPI00369CDDB7
MSNPYEQQPGYQPNLDPNYGYTPHAPAPVLAHWGQRVGASLIDGIIVGVPAFIIGQVAGAALQNVINLLGLIVWGYLEGTTGQTVGKKVLGLRTAKLEDGSLLGAGMGIARKLLHILDTLSCFVGYLWPLWDEKRQTFADKIVKSVVVVSK